MISTFFIVFVRIPTLCLRPTEGGAGFTGQHRIVAPEHCTRQEKLKRWS